MIATLANSEMLSSVEYFSEPFPYFVSPEALSTEISIAVLDWLERCDGWKLKETDFYEQYEFSLWDISLPDHLSFLKMPHFLNLLRERMQRSFKVPFQKRLDFTAHKLVPGQRIRLHNDYISGCETHRLLVQFNRQWSVENGGMLMLFNSPDPSDVHQIFSPVHNSAVGFAICEGSNHAVSTIHKGQRYTLVYSFYAEAENA